MSCSSLSTSSISEIFTTSGSFTLTGASTSRLFSFTSSAQFFERNLKDVRVQCSKCKYKIHSKIGHLCHIWDHIRKSSLIRGPYYEVRGFVQQNLSFQKSRSREVLYCIITLAQPAFIFFAVPNYDACNKHMDPLFTEGPRKRLD